MESRRAADADTDLAPRISDDEDSGDNDEEDMEDTSLVMPGEHGFSRSGSIN